MTPEMLTLFYVYKPVPWPYSRIAKDKVLQLGKCSVSLQESFKKHIAYGLPMLHKGEVIWAPTDPLPNPGSVYNGQQVAVYNHMFSRLKGHLPDMVLDLSLWDVSNMVFAQSMFFQLENIQVAGLEKWDVRNLQEAAEMFCETNSIGKTDFSMWELPKLQTSEYMFALSNAEKLNLQKCGMQNLAIADSMFSKCLLLKSLDCSGWILQNLKHAEKMFYNCQNLQEVETKQWGLSSLECSASMFEGCGKLSSLETRNWQTEHISNASRMFFGCRALHKLETSAWQFPLLKTASSMFQNCSSLGELDVANWHPSLLENTQKMFFGCSQIQELSLSNWELQHIGPSVFKMFMGCESLRALDLSTWALSNIFFAEGLFCNCKKMGSIKLPRAKVCETKTVAMDHMFYGCSKLEDLQLSQYFPLEMATDKNTTTKLTPQERVERLQSVFKGCSKLRTVVILTEVEGNALFPHLGLTDSQIFGI